MRTFKKALKSQFYSPFYTTLCYQEKGSLFYYTGLHLPVVYSVNKALFFNIHVRVKVTSVHKPVLITEGKKLVHLLVLICISLVSSKNIFHVC